MYGSPQPASASLLDAARETVEAAMEKNFAVLSVAIQAQIAEYMVLRFREEVCREVERILKGAVNDGKA